MVLERACWSCPVSSGQCPVGRVIYVELATGARAALFHGVREQSYIYHAMVEALGWTRGGLPVE